jgi:uncharacterized protein (TIGR04255 family)
MEFIAPFQEALRQSYPTMDEQRGIQLLFGPDGVTQSAGDRQWRLSSQDRTWSVVLAPSFVSLETTSFSSRSDFVARLADIAETLSALVGQVVVERLGVRYSDRLVGDEILGSLTRLVRMEVLGLVAVESPSAQIKAAVTQSEFALGDGTTMIARWGLLPGGNTLTPDIPPVEEPSWVLDIDASAIDLELSAPSVVEAARALCEHSYNFFRWAVTDEFLRLHGGDL